MKSILAKFLSLLISVWKGIPPRINRLIDRFEKEKEFRFYILGWAFFLVIVSGSFLTNSNPFRLLVPGLSYSFPRFDHRKEIHYFTLSRRDLKLIELNEKMERTGNIEEDGHRLAFVIRKPFPLMHGIVRPSASAFFFPAFDLALQKFWLKDGDLFVDVDTRFLNQEMDRFDRSAGSSGDMESSHRVARMFQICLTLSLFENFPEVKRIVFLADGDRIATGFSEPMKEASDLDFFLKKDEATKSKKSQKKKEEEIPPFAFDRIYVR